MYGEIHVRFDVEVRKNCKLEKKVELSDVGLFHPTSMYT